MIVRVIFVGIAVVMLLMQLVGCGGDNPAETVELGPEGRLFVLNQSDATLYVYDTKTLERVDSIDTRVKLPHYIEFSPDGQHFYITTLESTGRIAKFNARTLDFIDSVTVPPAVRPSAIAITADSKYGYVCNFSTPSQPSFIYKYDLTNMTLIDQVQAGVLTHDLKISSDGATIVATNRYSDNLTLVYTDGDTVDFVSADPDTVYPGGSHKYGPFGVIIDHSDSLAFVACMDALQVRVLDIAEKRVIDSVSVPVDTSSFISGPTLLAISPDNRTLFLSTRGGNSVVVIDVTDNSILADIPLATPNPFGITMSDDGSRVYVACIGYPYDHGRVYVIDGNTRVKIDSLDVGRESFGLKWHSLQ